MHTPAVSVHMLEPPRLEHAEGRNKDQDKALVRLLIGVGDRLGLFEELAARGSATTPQLASRTGLNEAYVTEWARAMAEAGRLDHDPATRQFAVPATV